MEISCYWSPLTTSKHSALGSTDTLKVRQLQLADITAAVEIISDSFQIGTAFGGLFQPLFKLGIHEDLRNRLQAPPTEQSMCLVATVGSARIDIDVVGTVEISSRSALYNPHVNQRYAYISNLAVNNGYRRTGIGRKLIKQCEGIAKRWGYTDVYLHVMGNNVPGRILYHKLGFEVVDSEWTWPFWPWERKERLFLRKRL